MTKKFTNNAYSKLASPVLTTDLSFTVTTGEGLKFPVLGAGDTCHCTLTKSDGTNEIVLVTARATDVFTMARAQESTAAMAFNAGDRVEHRITAGDVTGLQTATTTAQATADSAVTAAATADGKAVAAQATANAALPKAGGSITGTVNTSASINEAKAANVASASAPDIWTGNGNMLHITGTTTITGFAAAPQAGAKRRLICDAAVPFTAGANMVITGFVPGKTFIASAGDIVDVIADTTTLFRLSITRVSGLLPNPSHFQNNYLTGLMMSMAGASATISIAAGQAADSTNTVLMTSVAKSKTTSSWAVGDGVGGLDTGSIAASTWYYFYIIQRPDTGVVDVIFSLSSSAPTLPANYTQYRYIGGAATNGSSQWVKYIQVGDEFTWDVAVTDANGAGVVAYNLLTCSVPRGRKLKVLFEVGCNNSTSQGCKLLDPDTSSATSSYSSGMVVPSGIFFYTQASCFTNTAAQIRHIEQSTNNITIVTIGWVDTRGRI